MKALPFSSRLLVLPAAALLASACGPANTASNTCSESMLPGDLVITEVMANPDGTDDGNEWFEVYNATGAPIDVSGLRIVASRSDGTGEKAFALPKDTGIDAGQYYVLGDALQDATPEWESYGFGNALGSLRNSDGRIALVCRETTIDEVTYASAPSAASLSFTGALSPDSAANDDEANWCKSTVPYDGTNLGSPGAANEVCESGPAPTTCDDGGTAREIVSPGAGDLVFSEIMPNPAAADDATGEWFEVAVKRDVDLNGVEIGQTPGTPKVTLNGTACLHVQAGTWLVFARSDDPAVNGGLPSVYGTFSFGLTNTGGSLYLGIGDTVIDQASWTGSTSGVSIALDPGHVDSTSNDDPAAWCAGESAYGSGDLGTPGSPNAACPPIVPDGQCLEGSTVRDIVAPAVGDLRLNEIMADPAVVKDSDGEWFEVRVDKDVDLNGLELGTTPGTPSLTLGSGTCMPVHAGSYLVFAHSSDGTLNGGLPQVDYTFSFALTNSGGSLFVGEGGNVLDQTSWSSATSGVSSSRQEDGDTWCEAATDSGQEPLASGYGGPVPAGCDGTACTASQANFGTPGATNGTPVCP